MRWSFRIATIAGTEVRIHFTFFLLLLFVGFQAAFSGAGAAAAFHIVGLICAMFVCVLLHEFGHVFAARGYGIPTPDIILLPIGGVARLERMPRQPWQELVVAVAGPLVNVAIAAAIGIWLGVMPGSAQPIESLEQPGQFLEKLMAWNVVMVFFNLIPAFPMDGGRVLRALLAMVFEYGRATRWAATIGQGIALVTVLFMLLFGSFNPIILLIAFFIFMAAGQEAAAVNQIEATRGLRVRDAMLTDFRTLPPHARLQDAVDLLLAGTQQDFPIMDEGGRMLGILPRRTLISALTAHGAQLPVGEVAEACPESVSPAMSLEDAMQRLSGSACPALPVFDPMSSLLVGLLTSENIGEALMVRAALRERALAVAG